MDPRGDVITQAGPLRLVGHPGYRLRRNIATMDLAAADAAQYALDQAVATRLSCHCHISLRRLLLGGITALRQLEKVVERRDPFARPRRVGDRNFGRTLHAAVRQSAANLGPLDSSGRLIWPWPSALSERGKMRCRAVDRTASRMVVTNGTDGRQPVL